VARTRSVRLLPRHIADDDMQVLLNAADCVVLPYNEVLTSGAAMLAMSFGRPVVAPDLGGVRDYVDEASGALYDVSDPAGLMQAMDHVRLRSFDPGAIRRHIEPFSWHETRRGRFSRGIAC
jgi:glycosyltransferase involved in cell wall biosynthesis